MVGRREEVWEDWSLGRLLLNQVRRPANAALPPPSLRTLVPLPIPGTIRAECSLKRCLFN